MDQIFGLVFGITMVVMNVVVFGHPQCIDSSSPVPANYKRPFCSEYAKLGCCSSQTDDILRKEYKAIRRQMTRSERKSCKMIIKQLLCERCSPYADHTFDNGETRRPFLPGLCGSFCNDNVWPKCRGVLQYIIPNTGQYRTERNDIIALVEENRKEEFCAKVTRVDTSYCYPEWKENGDLQNELTEDTRDCVCVEPLIVNQTEMLFAVNPGDGTNRLFVGWQKGFVKIYLVNENKLRSSPFIDITNRVDDYGNERGLLGMAFHPRYSENGLFYLVYTTSDVQTDEAAYIGSVRISEFRVKETNPMKADPHYERKLLDIPKKAYNHNGGQILFGDDGYLYIFTGDAGGQNDVSNSSQNLTLMYGKVLRLDVDTGSGNYSYGIPPDNPFINTEDILPEIYAYGLRNPWRCGKDKGDPTAENRTGKGRILCGDVGQKSTEEINLIQAGKNYGWRILEGDRCLFPEEERDTLCAEIDNEENLAPPIHQYYHSEGKSIIGGEFYRGCLSPGLNGVYIYGDYSNRQLYGLFEMKDTSGVWENRRLTMCETLCSSPQQNDFGNRILSFGQDENGEVYLMTKTRGSEASAHLYRIVQAQRNGSLTTCS